MLRMSKLTDYGLVLLTHMAQGGNPAVRTAQELARCSRVPLPTVSKILKELSKAGIVASQRGRHGGYSLARPPELISVAAVIEAPEGPVRGRHPGHLEEEGRAGVDARVAPRGLPALARHGRARLAKRPLSEDQLPGHRLLLGPQAEEAARLAGRGRPGAQGGLR